ncbi:hypothetical protein CDO73_23530 [Saccharibacillus sp. O23]|uniref:hypothetical protein n=1 Tax=Saccharibacillus sp. O23 TaxID=2009338 RepID=UPI000B4E2C76|nr:hypothetical protein [Saccharibacillus sp. O23]OWR27220.1 hypothetical protein CDO73_23530 [Saccharibacillus sp. O23]
MIYQFETEKRDYSDYSSGRVLHHAPGTTAFPVRLGKEIMSRCLAGLRGGSDLKIYDPCCGGAYWLTMIGFNYGGRVSELYGSDIDEAALDHARRNLGLLTAEGLSARKESLRRDRERYGKDSHREALESAERLERTDRSAIRTTSCFAFDIAGAAAPPIANVNIVIADLPYGQMTSWGSGAENPVRRMLGNLHPVLDPEDSIVAIVCDKKQRAEHEAFERKGTMNHGKRKISFLRPLYRDRPVQDACIRF